MTAIRDVILSALPIVAAYVCGWLYLAEYLNSFGIDSTELNLTTASVMVYSVNVLRSRGFIIALCFAFIVAGLVMFAWKVVAAFVKDKLGMEGGALAVLVGAVAAVLAFYALATLSRGTAKDAVAAVWEGQRLDAEVTVTSDSALPNYRRYRACVSRRALVSVINTPDKLYLLCVGGSGNPNGGSLFAISEGGDISSVRFVWRKQ